MSQEQKETSNKLERTLGLGEALSIGVGTMVGAGIFIFPGIAAGYAGPAAMLSFAIAGGIALLVAFSTAELATSMPENGGAYFYVSRIFGSAAGFVVGIGQWIGLVFASAFYLTGFAQYVIQFCREWGFDLGEPLILIAFGVALVLTLINIFGTKGAGKLQNRIVLILSVILTLLFGYGIMDALGFIGKVEVMESFAPKGYWPVFTTAALIFTSYLGFVQISTVAGEIKAPKANLPKALIGSVLLVMGLYLTALFVTTNTLPIERLQELGETAMVEVARELTGWVGAIGILGAGLLATLSSANASILSSSRAAFALSKDKLIPKEISKVSRNFGTPHIAIIAVGLPIAALTLMGRIEILAEVASFLHLVMYGMICITLIKVKMDKPWWYRASFRAPGKFIIPVLGALFCFGLIGMMQPLSLIIGLSIILVALVWYFFFAPTIEFSLPETVKMDYQIEKPKIIVTMDVDDPDPVPEALIRSFRDLELLVLAYKKVPEQTSPEQSREEFEEEAKNTVDKILEEMEDLDIHVRSKLVFTPDLAETTHQYAEEEDSHAVLKPSPIETVERLLVPVYAKEQISTRWATILKDLAHSSDLPLSLIILTSRESESEEEKDIEKLKNQALIELKRAGLSDKKIRSKTVDVENVSEAVQKLSEDGDLVILGESSPTERESFFKTLHEEIEEASSSPILTISQEE